MKTILAALFLLLDLSQQNQDPEPKQGYQLKAGQLALKGF
jgi:hypothetical protein